MNQRKIARTAAEVSNENEFIVIERGFVVVSGRYRFHLKLHGLISGQFKRRLQSTLGVTVILVLFSP